MLHAYRMIYRRLRMLDLRKLEELADEGPAKLRELLLPPDAALAELPEVDLASGDAAKFCGGQPVSGASDARGLARVYDEKHEFLGVGEVSGAGKLAPRRVFRTAARKTVDI